MSGVDVRVAEQPWRQAQVEPSTGWQWQRFWLDWIPQHRGAVELSARAVADGVGQPLSGRRNAVHRVSVTVT